jgi:hypothetical protein
MYSRLFMYYVLRRNYDHRAIRAEFIHLINFYSILSAIANHFIASRAIHRTDKRGTLCADVAATVVPSRLWR